MGYRSRKHIGLTMECLNNFLENICRKKTLEENVLSTKLNRCLNLFDLILLGVGNMVGAGIFVVIGNALKNVAGPGVVISFILAGFASFLSALCYAEFGARVPKAGSAYTYTYITIGEIVAFIIGWNMIMECVIGTASVSKAWSGSVDVLFKGAITNGTMEHIGRLNVPLFSHYLDFVAFGCLLVWVIFVAAGAKVSSGLINIFTIIKISILFFVMGLGSYYANFSYWRSDQSDGFLPYGFSGVLAGSASCFYAYTGFETIATAGEETKNPSKNVPLALSITVLLVTILYLGTSITLSLIVSYKQVDTLAPFPSALQALGLNWATNVVAIGTIIGLSSTILCSLFGMSRAVYSMASDGLLFTCLAYVHPKTQTPVVSILSCGTFTAVLALLVDLELLVELLSIGALLCFTIVSVNVVIIRYQPVSSCQFELKPDQSTESESTNCEKIERKKSCQNHDDIGKLKRHFSKLTFLECIPPGYVGTLGVILILASVTGIWLVTLFAHKLILLRVWWIILLLTLLILGFVLSFLFLFVHEENKSFTTFQTPFVPLTPVASISINVGVMLKLNGWTWVRLAVCIAVGIIIYFAYGIRHSRENVKFKSYEAMIPSEEETALSEKPETAEEEKLGQ